MVRWLPPKGGGADTPGRLTSVGPHADVGRLLDLVDGLGLALQDDVADRHAAGVEAHDERGHGARRHERRERFTWATTSAIAWTMSVPGWKKIFIWAKPWMLRLST